MPASDPQEEPQIVLTPRSVAADVFEQNPISSAHERNASTALTAAELDSIPEEERVREAVRRVIQEGRPIHEVARELRLSATSIRAWKSKYSSFLQEHAFGESNPAVAAEDSNLSRAQQTKFMENWQELLVETHASEEDFKQEPLLVFFQTNSATSWLYDEEGKLERFSLFGILLIFLGIASVLIFLTVDKGIIEPAQDFQVTDSLLHEPTLRYDLDIDRAGKVVQNFLQADGYIAKLNFLRERDRVEPIVREFYQTHSDKPLVGAQQSYGMVGHGLVSLAFEIPNGDSLFFNLAPHGKSYLIDWFTSTLYQTDHIEKLIANKSTTPTLLHVQVERDTYFNYQFTKEEYECFKIKFPGLIRDLVGYARKESPAATELLLLTALEPMHAAVIEVRYPADPKDVRQLEIVKFVDKDWLPF